MNAVISKWTAMLTEASQGGLTILGTGAVVAIIVFIVMGIFSPGDQERAATIRTIVVILIFCALAIGATGLVQWAMS